MKLHTQFTVLKNMRDLDYFKKIQILDDTLKQTCINYPSEEDCLVYCD